MAKNVKISQSIRLLANSKDMSELYKHLCVKFGWPLDMGELQRMEGANQRKLEEIENKLKDAKENLGDGEVFQALLEKLLYYIRIGGNLSAQEEESLESSKFEIKPKSDNPDLLLELFALAKTKAIGIGQKIDILLMEIRFAIFWENFNLLKVKLDEAKISTKNADWDRKNRLKSYELVYAFVARQWDRASSLLIETISSFSSVELFSLDRFICYAVALSILTQPRKVVNEKVNALPEHHCTSDAALALHASRCTLHASRFTLRASRCALHAARFTLRASRCALHAARFTLHASRFTLHASRFTLRA
jgi:26S proteasome regulatory subunit N7